MNVEGEKQVSALKCLGNEFLHGLLSLIIFTGWYVVFSFLLPSTEWVFQVWPALVLTLFSRSALLRRSSSQIQKPETWRGWLAADLLVIGFFIYDQQSFPEVGFILFITPVTGAAFRNSPYLIARLSAVTFALFIVARSLVDVPTDAFVLGKQIVAVLIFLATAMFISVHQYRYKRTVARFGSEALSLFERVHLNLILIDHQQKIIDANRCALDLLQIDAKSVKGQPLRRHILDSPEYMKNAETGRSQGSGLITQNDGVLKKVKVEQIPLNLPMVLDRLGAKGNTEECSLVLLTDMSAFLQEHEAERVAKQNSVLKRMLEVFADGVRNPLAGISAHIQVLARNGAAETEEERVELHKRYDTIVEEIEEIDSLMETLMNHARLTPEDVEKRFQALKEKRQNRAV